MMKTTTMIKKKIVCQLPTEALSLERSYNEEIRVIKSCVDTVL